MDACAVMASGRERSPTIITPTLAPSWCHRKQASLGANDQHTLRTPDARIAPNVIFCS